MCENEELLMNNLDNPASRPILNALYRYAHFMSSNPNNYAQADIYYRKILNIVPGTLLINIISFYSFL